MAARLIVICNLERLPALDAAPASRPVFGMNIAVAWDRSNPPIADFRPELLMPWAWARVKKVKYCWRRGVSTEPVAEATVANPTPAIEPAMTATLRAQFDDIILVKGGGRSQSNLLWPLTAGTDRAVRVAAAGARPWNAFVMNLATGPGSLSRQLNLAFTFECDVPADRTGLELIAAPVLEADGLFAGGRQPTGDPVADTSLASPILWQYADGDPAIVACTAPCAIDVRSAGAIDLSTQWVTLPAAARTVSFDDWEPALTRRASEGFRQDRFLRDYMRSAETAALDGELSWLLADRFLASLRDAAGAGLHEGTHGARPAAILFSRTTPGEPITLTTEQWQSLQAAEQGSFASLNDWTALLKRALPEVADLKILTPAEPVGGAALGRPILDSKAVAAEVCRLMEVFDDARPGAQQQASPLWRIVIAQWEALLPKAAAIDQSTQTRILRKLRAQSERENAGIELDGLLADELLGRYWRDFIASNKAAPSQDPLGTGLVEASYPWFALYHARTRWGVAQPDAPSTNLAIPQRSVELPARPRSFVPTPPGQLPGPSLDALERYFRDWIEQSRQMLRPTAPALATVPPPLTIQLARLESDNDEQAAPDVLRQLSGFGVLMRERPLPAQPAAAAPPWRCLNMATLPVGGKEPRESTALLVPYRLHYQGGLRRVSVSYNNQSLVADSPLGGREMAGVQLEQRGSDESASVLGYRYAPSEKLPGLKFGRSYEFAVFGISNAGTLPKEIALPGQPFALRQPTLAEESALRQTGVIQPPVAYRRTIPVGELRLCGTGARDDGGDEPMRLPSIPDSVAPLALELLDALMPETKSADAKVPRPPLILLSPASWKGAFPASRATHTAEFAVRLPQVTWSCYDRWASATTGVTADQRKALIAEVHRRHAGSLKQASTAVKGTSPTRAPDTSLDDPAVTNLIHLELFVEESGTLRSLAKEFVEVPPPDPRADPVARLNAGRAVVRCEFLPDTAPAGPAGTLTVEPPGPQTPRSLARVRIREGRVYKLTLSACVPVDKSGGTGESRMFDDVVLRSKGRAPDQVANPKAQPGGQLYLMSRTDVLIEGATAEMPSSAELYEASVPRVEVEVPPGALSQLHRLPGVHAVRVALTPLPDVNAPANDVNMPRRSFKWLHRAELHRQAWGWTGRNTALHPHLQRGAGADATALNDAVRNWVAEEFGERPENEFTTSTLMARTLTHGTGASARPRPGFRTFVYDHVLATDAASHDLRGQHFRYSVRAYSRYAALMPEGLRSRTAGITSGTRAQNQPVTTRWHEVFVPSRRRPPLDPPRVKLILPLTEGLNAGVMGTPGLLVVLNEPWYEAAGLGEAFSVEIGEVSSPWDTPAEKGRTYLEFGPDPVIQPLGTPPHEQPIVPNEPPVRIGDSDEMDPSRVAVTGPVGHYFDRDNNVALFVGSSFIVPAPHAKRTDTGSRAWYFARLRFKRKVLTREPRTGGGRYEPNDRTWPIAEYYSEPSSDVWVQYLPEFSVYDGWTGQLGSLTPEFPSGTTMRLRDGGGAIVPLEPTASAKGIFKLFAVLTKMVFDARGTQGEVYVTAFAQSTDQRSWTTDVDITAFKDLAHDRYRVRLIEVQIGEVGPAPACAPTPPSGSNLWGWLFPDKSAAVDVRGQSFACDTPARIVRVSRPFPDLPHDTQ